MYKKIALSTATAFTPDTGVISSQPVSLLVPSSQLLPLSPVPQPSSFSSQASLSAESPLIMVIDDSGTVRKILQTCLGREGFPVVAFPDGIEAMRWLKEPTSRIPNVIILDIGLPKMDGYEVAKHLKAKPEFSNTVIIMLSRRDGVIDRLKGRLAGAKEYLTKPFQTQMVIAVVKSYVGSPLPR
jgi:twitching motility two-component system response regulator PilG